VWQLAAPPLCRAERLGLSGGRREKQNPKRNDLPLRRKAEGFPQKQVAKPH